MDLSLYDTVQLEGFLSLLKDKYRDIYSQLLLIDNLIDDIESELKCKKVVL